MQSLQPEQIVQKQLDAYNSRNILDFVLQFHDNAEFYRYSETTPFLKGKERIKSYYTELFEESIDLKSEIKTRTVIGNKVIDHEIITGRMGKAKPIELVLIFEISGDKIIRCEVLTKN